MKSLIKIALARLFPVLFLRYKAYKTLISNKSSYLYLTGWMQSIKEQKPVDNKAHPIPWMNYSVLRLLEEKLKHDLNLFEFGSGYSTLFYASRVRTVTSIEHDETWYGLIKPLVPENVRLIFKEKDIDGAYCRVIISTEDRYDVVIVDGRDRVNCIRQSIEVLSPIGIIILDDSQRDKYQEGIEFAKRKGFKALNIEGLKAMYSGTDRATILYREGNCLDI